MSFVSRAERARARGDEARALMVLIEGLKREPGLEEAIDLLVCWYSVERPLAGIEEDVVRVVAIQPNPDDLLSVLHDNLRANQNEVLASSLLEHGVRLGLSYIPASLPPVEDGEIGVLLQEDGAGTDQEPPVSLAPEGEGHIEEASDDMVPPATDAWKSLGDEKAEEKEETSTTAKNERPSSPRNASNRARIRPLLMAFVLFLALGLGWWALNSGKRAAAIQTLDTAIETIDPHSGEKLLELVEEMERDYPDDAEVLERGFFVRAELQTDLGPIGLKEPVTMWGVGALASSSIAIGDIEGGIRYVTHLERGFPETIPALWSKTKLAELRGHEREMMDTISELNRRFPEFLPGWIAKLRLDIRRMDREGMSQSKKRIESLVPDHPYVGIPDSIFPSPELIVGGFHGIGKPTNPTTAWSDQSDAFLKSLSNMNRSIQALQARDYQAAREAIDVALESEPELGPALFISGMVKLRDYDLEGISSLRLISQIEGASDELIQMTQAFGTLALVGLGRAMDAGYFVPRHAEGGKTGVQEGGFRRVLREDATAYGPLATFGRRLVEYELGIGPNVEVIEIQESRDRGAWDEVIQAYDSLKDGNSLYVGDIVLAHLALGHLEEALAELAEPTSVLGDIFMDGPRLVVGVWRNPSDPQTKERMERLLSLDPKGVWMPIWIADALIWQGEFERAEWLLSQVFELQKEHARASWLFGISLRQRGEFRGSDHQFQRARPDLDVNSLIELGDRFSMTKNHDESRKMYHKAILEDRENLRALRGLGRSYAELGNETAVRDLERIAQSYAGEDWVAQRAESLKWLAVSLGVRDGNPAGLIPLEEAEKLVGKRADILVEQAQYHEATGDETGARKLYGQALQSNSTLGEAHLGLGRTALIERDLRVARDHLRKYLELVPRGKHRSWAEGKLSALE